MSRLNLIFLFVLVVTYTPSIFGVVGIKELECSNNPISSLEMAENGVVRVSFKTSLSYEGAGFIVGKKGKAIYIVTALHVVTHTKGKDRGKVSDNVFIEFNSLRDQKWNAKVWEYAKEHDLAILKVNEEKIFFKQTNDFVCLPIKSHTSENNTNVDILIGEFYSIGHPKAFKNGWFPRKLIQIRLDNKDIIIQSEVEEGESGGPLIQKLQGNHCVVGLIRERHDSLGKAIPYNILSPFLLKKIKPFFCPKKPSPPPPSKNYCSPIQPPPSFPSTHVVQKNDNLGCLAGKYYGNIAPEYWCVIYDANKKVIGGTPRNHTLKLGTKLTIPDYKEKELCDCSKINSSCDDPPPSVLKQDFPITHVVRKGDRLEILARKYYGKIAPQYWCVIYDANKKVIGGTPRNHTLKLGNKLIIPDFKGKKLCDCSKINTSCDDPPPPVLKQNFPITHVVRKGDRLEILARKYYGKIAPQYWCVIYDANKKVIGGTPKKPILKLETELTIPAIPDDEKELCDCQNSSNCGSKPSLPTTHVVQKGDSLENLARKYYGKEKIAPQYWCVIYNANKKVIGGTPKKTILKLETELTIPAIPDDEKELCDCLNTSNCDSKPSSPTFPITHVVQKGDNLENLARKYYGKIARRYWCVIYNANKKLISGTPRKHTLHSGTKLTIPNYKGKRLCDCYKRKCR